MHRSGHFLLAAALVAAASGCGSTGSSSGGITAIDRATNERSDELAAASPSSDAGGDTPTEQAPTEDVIDAPAPVCSFAGISDDPGGMLVDLDFVHDRDSEGLEVTYALTEGPDGTRFYTGTAGGLDHVGLEFPSQGERFHVRAETWDDLPAGIEPSTIGCKVLQMDTDSYLRDLVPADGSETCEVVAADGPRGARVRATVTSPYDTTTTLQTWWALVGPDGARFATDTDVTELVAAGETITIAPEHGPEHPEWVTADQVTCRVVGYWKQAG